MKRESSPPDAIFVIGAKGAPGLVETSNSTRSWPVSVSGLGASTVRKARAIELKRHQLGGDGRIKLLSSRTTRFGYHVGFSQKDDARSIDSGFETSDPRAAVVDDLQSLAKLLRNRS